MMQGGGIGPADVGDTALAEPGEDALPDDLAIELGGAGLQVVGNVLIQEAPGEVGHGGAARLAGRLPLQVAPGPGEGDDLRGARPPG